MDDGPRGLRYLGASSVVSMTAGLATIATPLGDLCVTVATGGSNIDRQDRSTVLPSGAHTGVWEVREGLVVDSLVTQYAWPPDPSPDWAPVTCWGVELRLHAQEDTALVTVSALLPAGSARGSSSGDENIAIVEFETADWVLAIGGPDDAMLADAAAKGEQPPSWSAAQPPRSSASGLRWELPALASGDDARMWVTVAWCQPGHPRSGDTPWFAVDVGPEWLRDAAGVRLISFPKKKRRSKSPDR